MTQKEAISVAKQLHGEEIMVVRKPLEGTVSRKWRFHPSFLGELFVPGGETSWWVFKYAKSNSSESFSHLKQQPNR